MNAEEEEEPKADQQKLANAIANIFGDSDSDLDDLGEVQNVEFDDSDQDVPLPSFKKRTTQDNDEYQESSLKPKKKKEKSRRKRDDQEEQPESQRAAAPKVNKSEAERDIDEILSRLKPIRPKKGNDLQNEVEVDDFITGLVNSMRTAADNDQELNRNGSPAIAKLKLLPSVMIHLSKTHWFAQLLDSNILECIKFWLEPLADGSLPSLDIQQSMLSVVEKMPVETHHLRTSLIGRVLMFYTKCERVTPQVKKRAEGLIRTWMRPILGKSSDHRHKKLREARYDAPRSRPNKAVQIAKPSSFERSNMASIPQKVAPNFSIAPVSSYGSPQALNGPAEKKADRFKKIKSSLRSLSARKG